MTKTTDYESMSDEDYRDTRFDHDFVEAGKAAALLAICLIGVMLVAAIAAGAIGWIVNPFVHAFFG